MKEALRQSITLWGLVAVTVGICVFIVTMWALSIIALVKYIFS